MHFKEKNFKRLVIIKEILNNLNVLNIIKKKGIK